MEMLGAHGVAKFFMAACLFGFAIAGIVFFAIASKVEDQHEVADFRRAVEAWPRHKTYFKSLDVTSAFQGSGFTSQRHVLLKTSSLDDSKGFLNAEHLSPYDPLTYRLESVPSGFMPQVNLQTVEWTKAIGSSRTRFSGVFVRLHLEISGDVLTTERIPLLQAKPHPRVMIYRSQCGELHGVYVGNVCWIYRVLQSICLQVTYSDARWQFALRFPGDNSSYGCAYAARNWTATRYKIANDHVSFRDLEVVIRSEHDPFLKALELTGGALDFGMTAKDERWLGVFLLGLASLMSCPAVVALCLYSRAQAKKRRLAAGKKTAGSESLKLLTGAKLLHDPAGPAGLSPLVSDAPRRMTS